MKKLLFTTCFFALITTSMSYAKDNKASTSVSESQGLSGTHHGWEPDLSPSIADKDLILSLSTDDFVTICRAFTCLYDEERHEFKGIKLMGDFGLLEVLKHDDGRPWMTAVNEFNGEWVIVNPIRQTDAVMDCLRVGTMGHHGQDESTATDSICTIKGANNYTLQMSETLEEWVVDRNIEILEAKIKKVIKSRKAHFDTMGPDAGTEEGKRVYQ